MESLVEVFLHLELGNLHFELANDVAEAIESRLPHQDRLFDCAVSLARNSLYASIDELDDVQSSELVKLSVLRAVLIKVIRQFGFWRPTECSHSHTRKLVILLLECTHLLVQLAHPGKLSDEALTLLRQLIVL